MISSGNIVFIVFSPFSSTDSKDFLIYFNRSYLFLRPKPENLFCKMLTKNLGSSLESKIV